MEKRYTISYLICVILFLFEATWGITQLVSSHFLYATGSFINSGPFSCFLAVLIPLVIRLYYLTRKNWIKTLCSIALLFGCLLIPFLLSRTALVASTIGVIIVCSLPIYYRVTSKKILILKRRKLILIISILIITVIALALFVKVNSANGRLLIWKIVLKYINPDILLSGVGWGRSASVYAELQEQYFSSNLASNYEGYLADTPNYLFNEYLQCLLAFGLLGLSFLIGCLIYSYIQCKKYNLIGITGALTSFSIVMFFSYPLHCWEFWLIPIIFGINTIICLKINVKSLLIIILIIFCGYCGYYNYSLQKNLRLSFNIAVTLFNNREYSLSNQILMEIVEPMSPDVKVLHLIAQNYRSQGNTEQAISYYLKSAKRVPNRIYPHFKLLEIYIDQQDYINAEKEAMVILNHKPKINSPAIEEIKSFAIKFLNSNKYIQTKR